MRRYDFLLVLAACSVLFWFLRPGSPPKGDAKQATASPWPTPPSSIEPVSVRGVVVGMARAQVIDVLGLPDDVGNESDTTTSLNYPNRTKDGSRLTIILDNKSGLVQSVSGPDLVVHGKEFILGRSFGELAKALGPPDQILAVQSQAWVVYHKFHLGIPFSARNRQGTDGTHLFEMRLDLAQYLKTGRPITAQELERGWRTGPEPQSRAEKSASPGPVH